MRTLGWNILFGLTIMIGTAMVGTPLTFGGLYLLLRTVGIVATIAIFLGGIMLLRVALTTIWRHVAPYKIEVTR